MGSFTGNAYQRSSTRSARVVVTWPEPATGATSVNINVKGYFYSSVSNDYCTTNDHYLYILDWTNWSLEYDHYDTTNYTLNGPCTKLMHESNHTVTIKRGSTATAVDISWDLWGLDGMPSTPPPDEYIGGDYTFYIAGSGFYTHPTVTSNNSYNFAAATVPDCFPITVSGGVGYYNQGVQSIDIYDTDETTIAFTWYASNPTAITKADIISYWQNWGITKVGINYYSETSTFPPAVEGQTQTVYTYPPNMQDLYYLSAFSVTRIRDDNNNYTHQILNSTVTAIANKNPFVQYGVWCGAYGIIPTFMMDGEYIDRTHTTEDAGILSRVFTLDTSIHGNVEEQLIKSNTATYTCIIVSHNNAIDTDTFTLSAENCFIALRPADVMLPYDRIGIGNGSPITSLDIIGSVHIPGSFMGSGIVSGCEISDRDCTPIMTSNIGADGSVSSATSVLGTAESYMAFDRNPNTQWHSAQNQVGTWEIYFSFPEGVSPVIQSYSLSCAATAWQATEWSLNASTDGTSSWGAIDTRSIPQTGAGSWSVYETKTWNLPYNTIPYRYYKLRITGSMATTTSPGTPHQYVTVGEWSLYTAPNGVTTDNPTITISEGIVDAYGYSGIRHEARDVILAAQNSVHYIYLKINRVTGEQTHIAYATATWPTEEQDYLYVLLGTANSSGLNNGIQRMVVPVKSPDLYQWHTLNLNTGWTNYGASYTPAKYIKDREGNVRVHGLLAGNTTTAGITVGTLPPGYKPKGYDFLCSTYGSLGLCRIDAMVNGDIRIQTPGTWAFTSLDSLFFTTL